VTPNNTSTSGHVQPEPERASFVSNIKILIPVIQRQPVGVGVNNENHTARREPSPDVNYPCSIGEIVNTSRPYLRTVLTDKIRARDFYSRIKIDNRLAGREGN
jgi:hypothetical protein